MHLSKSKRTTRASLINMVETTSVGENISEAAKAPTKRNSQEKFEKKKSVLSHVKRCWSNCLVDHPWVARIVIALGVCAVFWIILWFVLFSGMSQAADFLYAKF